MRLSAFAICIVAWCLAGTQPVEAAGPLQGNWGLSCSPIVGSPAPFTQSTFAFTQQTTLFQAQNTPIQGQPLCTMLGVQASSLIVAIEVIGIPRSSSGIVIGIVTGDTSMNSLWIDTQGLYVVTGSKLP